MFGVMVCWICFFLDFVGIVFFLIIFLICCVISCVSWIFVFFLVIILKGLYYGCGFIVLVLGMIGYKLIWFGNEDLNVWCWMFGLSFLVRLCVKVWLIRDKIVVDDWNEYCSLVVKRGVFVFVRDLEK